jgi:2-dehydro-3-deoxyglucarate aldolase/4-hydroxy-2-oxoheptanedioate aldolase
MDLATSMGSFGNPKDERVQEAIGAIEGKVLKSGKVLGTVAGTWEEALEKYKKGYSLVVGFSDTTSLSQSAVKRVEVFFRQYPDR